MGMEKITGSFFNRGIKTGVSQVASFFDEQ